MSESNNARTSRIMANVERGVYIRNSKFRGYGETDVDRASWDYRARRQGEKLARIEKRKAK